MSGNQRQGVAFIRVNGLELETLSAVPSPQLVIRGKPLKAVVSMAINRRRVKLRLNAKSPVAAALVWMKSSTGLTLRLSLRLIPGKPG